MFTHLWARLFRPAPERPPEPRASRPAREIAMQARHQEELRLRGPWHRG